MGDQEEDQGYLSLGCAGMEGLEQELGRGNLCRRLAHKNGLIFLGISEFKRA